MKMNDNLVKQIFRPNGSKHILTYKKRIKIIENNKDLKNYLDNRYDNLHDYDEIIYCILNNYEYTPKCKICGNNIKFKNISEGYRNVITCGNKECRKKIYKQIILEKYGVDNPAKLPSVQEKIKNTNIEKYGVDNPAKSIVVKQKMQKTIKSKTNEQKEKIKEKIKTTLLERYGVSNNLHIPEIEQRIKDNNQKKYGVDYCLSSSIIRNKIRNTSLLKYGVDNPAKSDIVRKIQSSVMLKHETQEKINNTKKLKHTYNTSKIEQEFKKYLELYYSNDFEYQYRSKDYPFNCDFYIKSLNLFIEIQASWVHGKHPFNENDKNDLDRLNCMKLKNSKYYNNAIIVWTHRDVMKRNIAKENNLIYLEIFSNNINECIQLFEQKVNSLLMND